MLKFRDTTHGFTLIELMIIMAIVVVLATIAVPAYQNYMVRSKVTQGLNDAGAALETIAEICKAQPARSFDSTDDLGPIFTPTNYASGVDLAPGSDCGHRVFVNVYTQNTGAESDVVLTLVGTVDTDSHHIDWDCRLYAGESRHVPAECRDPWKPQ